MRLLEPSGLNNGGGYAFIANAFIAYLNAQHDLMRVYIY